MIHAVFFDIGGTVHTQDATPESDRDYIRRLWCFLHMNHIYTAETPEQLLEHINAGAKAYKSYTEQELIELPPDMIWQKFFLKDFDIPAEKLAGLGEELCYMFDRYRKHIVKREGLKETLEALRQRGYRLGVISNLMSTTFVPRILEEHGIAQYFETITMSSVCGIRKPRPEIFEIALNEMRIGKEQAAYVGDTISRDVRGVRNAGWPLMIQTYLIVFPLLDMISTSFTLAQKDARLAGGTAGSFTLYYWQRLLGSALTKQMLLQPLLNSLLIGVCVSFFAILIGSVLAWLMVRTDLPFKPFFSLAVIIPYMIPSWCKSQAWLTMFKTERIGGAPGFLMSLGINVPDWLAYGPIAIITVLSLHYYAYAYLLVSAALNSINSELEEMGEIQGAGKATILRKITFPLVLPAMLSAVILTFSKAIGTFGVINYLGSKVNFVTLSSQLYMNSKSQNTQTAFAMALIMICIASISVFVNQKLIGSRKSYATIGGKGGRSTPIRLGKHKPLITAVLFLFFVFGIIMPIALLILESFMLRQGDYSLSNLTLHYWIGDPIATVMEGQPGIFKNANFINSLINSLKLTFVNGVFGTIFGQIIGYICAKGRGKLHGKVVEQLVFIPYLIPSIAFGGIFLSMFSAPQQLFGVTLVPSLYGTFALLTITSVVKHLPFASRAGTSNMLQIGGELEEAAEIAGAGFFKRFIRIVFPLSKGGFVSGFMLIFVSIMKELDLIILLMTPKTSTLPYLAFQYQNSNSPQASDCVAIVMFSIVFLVYALANIFGDADLAKSMGG